MTMTLPDMLNHAAEHPTKWDVPGLLREAADRLTDGIRWRSAVSEPPEADVDVLLWCGWHITGKRKDDPSTHFVTEDGANPIYMVTHWMPLPEGPK